MKNGTGLDFKMLSLREVFEGDARNGSEQYLHHVFSAAVKITILSRRVDPVSLASITCGMQPIVGREIPIRLILFSSKEEHFSGEISDAVSQRLGVYAFAKTNSRLEIIGLHKSEAGTHLFAGMNCDIFLLLEDQSMDSVIIKWIKPLFSSIEPTIRYELNWSFGDPNKQVTKTKDRLDIYLRSAPKGSESDWFNEFNKRLDALPPIRLPFKEDFLLGESSAHTIKLYEHQKKQSKPG